MEVRLQDARTLAVLGAIDAGGAASGGAFRADGARFALNVAGTRGPAAVVSVDVQTLKPTPLRSEERLGLGPQARPSARIVVIPAFDGKPLPLNV